VFLNLKGELSPASWERLFQDCPDLPLDDLVDDKEYMAQNPFLSLAIHTHCTAEELELMLDSVYAQDNPSFEVLIFEDQEPRKYQEKQNFRSLKEGKDWKLQAIEESKGDYLWFLDDLLILGPGAIRNFTQYSHNGEMDMVAAPLSQLDKENSYPSQELVYLHRNTLQANHHSPLNLMDLYLSNKIIKRKFLLEKKFQFSGDTPRDIQRLYQETRFWKVHQKNLFSFKDEAELLESLQNTSQTLKAKINLVLSSRRVLYQGIKLKRTGI